MVLSVSELGRYVPEYVLSGSPIMSICQFGAVLVVRSPCPPIAHRLKLDRAIHQSIWYLIVDKLHSAVVSSLLYNLSGLRQLGWAC